MQITFGRFVREDGQECLLHDDWRRVHFRRIRRRNNEHMNWLRTLPGLLRKMQVWAAVGTARVLKDTRYSSQEKYAFLVMVQSDEPRVEERVAALLNLNGWRDVVIDRIKLLDSPFDSDDRVMLDCYKTAAQTGGGIVIYSDPVPDSERS
jgi:hypothetical protein